MYITPDSYQISRELFIKDLPNIKNLFPEAIHKSIPIPDSSDLTIDLISCEGTKAENLIFLTTGLHGIEGFIGSILLQLFIKEFLPLLDPTRTGILLVHCINPSGMQRHYRTNRENVDLNRNFVPDFAKMKGNNPDYKFMDKFLNPKFPVRSELATKTAFIFQTLKWLVLAGSSRVRNAALMGQYEDQAGMYFGGREIQAETKIMMGIIDKWITRFEKTIHLDMHSGYGSRYKMTLVQATSEPLTSAEARQLFNIPSVASSNSEEFYKMNGEMCDYIHKVARDSNRTVYSAAFEFGTYGDGILQEARSLLTTIVANQFIGFSASPSNRLWVESDYQELYFPSESTWLEKSIQNGRQAFYGILHAKGLI